MMGKDNLRWPRQSNVQNGSHSCDTMIKQIKFLHRTRAPLIDAMAKSINKLHLPQFDPLSLITYCHNLKRRQKMGLWCTAEEYINSGEKGLYSGHYEILTMIGYQFPNKS